MELHINKIFATKTRRHQEKIYAKIFRTNLSVLESWWLNEYYLSFFSDQIGCFLAGGGANKK